MFYRMYMYELLNEALKFSERYVGNEIEGNYSGFKGLSLGYLFLSMLLTILLVKRMTRAIRIIKEMLRETFT